MKRVISSSEQKNVVCREELQIGAYDMQPRARRFSGVSKIK